MFIKFIRIYFDLCPPGNLSVETEALGDIGRPSARQALNRECGTQPALPTTIWATSALFIFLILMTPKVIE